MPEPHSNALPTTQDTGTAAAAGTALAQLTHRTDRCDAHTAWQCARALCEITPQPAAEQAMTIEQTPALPLQDEAADTLPDVDWSDMEADLAADGRLPAHHTVQQAEEARSIHAPATVMSQHSPPCTPRAAAQADDACVTPAPAAPVGTSNLQQRRSAHPQPRFSPVKEAGAAVRLLWQQPRCPSTSSDILYANAYPACCCIIRPHISHTWSTRHARCMRRNSCDADG